MILLKLELVCVLMGFIFYYKNERLYVPECASEVLFEWELVCV